MSIPMILQLSVSGLGFSGADVGGFFASKNLNESDHEKHMLLMKWHALSVFQPFMRQHSHKDAKRREPFLFKQEVFDVLRWSIRQRQVLMPYLYTIFKEYSAIGVPPMRPVHMEFPSEPIRDDYLFMCGPSLLVKPATTEDDQT